MKKSDLLKYLNDCKDLELTIYTLYSEQEKLNKKIKSLGIAHDIQKPYFHDPESVRAMEAYREFFWWDYFETLGCTLCLIFMPVAIIICTIINIISYIVDLIKSCKEYETAHQNYILDSQKDRERVANEQNQKPIIQKRINELQKQITETREVLNNLYSVGIIYPKYHSLVPIVMFCEYFESGRCSNLEGYDGAYNTYESELRQNIIISKLDVIISSLEQIKQNQWSLYNAIERGNQKIDQLCNATYKSAMILENIERNSVICSENSRIAAQNTRILADIEKYKLYIDDNINVTIPNRFLY